jgi:predicted ATPase
VFVPLAAVEDPALVLPRVADALGVALEGTRPVLDVLVEHIGDAPTLLVLDNLEQVVDVAPDLDELLTRCPGLEILATSRTVLRIRAERELPVGTLELPESSDALALDELAASPAVRLFIDRAQAVRRDFTLTEQNAPAVVAICRRLDGLPLAIELAAARIRLLDPAALLKRLEDRIDALGTGPVDLPERQRTLRATIEWSMSLLDEHEQRLLEVLSVFADGWTLEAAVDVAGLDEDDTLDRLDALAGHSLVSITPTDAGPRFRMLTAVREISGERLADSHDADDVARRHAQHFGALVENADWPAERQYEWAERLRVDEENLRVAIRWFLDHDVTPLPHAFRILWLFWQLRGRMPEARAWIEAVEPHADELNDLARAELLITSAVVAIEVGDDESGLAALDGLRALEGQIDDPYLESAAALATSWILPLIDDFDGALDAAARALDGFRSQDDPFMAFAVFTMGMVEVMTGRAEPAQEHLEDVVEIGGRFGNEWLVASARALLATLAVDTDRVDDARSLLADSVAFGDDADSSTVTVTFSLVAAAALACAAADPRRAATALGAAEGLRARAGLRGWPSTRPHQAELTTRVEAAMDADEFARAVASGLELSRRDAVALVRTIAAGP